MARWLTPLRTAGLAIATGLLLGLALGQASTVRAPAGRVVRQGAEARAMRLLSGRARAATEAWGTAVLVESVRRSGPAEGTVTGREVPLRLLEQITAAAGTLPSPRAGPGMAVVAVPDSATESWYWSVRLTFALPRTRDEPCLAIVQIGARALADQRTVGNLAATLGERLPGPCAFATEFGLPGPAVADWLGTSNGRFALDPDWDTAQAPLHDAAYSLRDLVYLTRGLSGPYYACRLGDMAACREWLMRGTGNYYSGQPIPLTQRRELARVTGPVVTTTRVGTRIDAYTYRRDVPGHLLADLVATAGRDAFRAFWTSTAEFDEAFASAFGRTPGRWVADWLENVNMPLPRELRSPTRAIPSSLLLIVVFVSGALLYTSRRTVSL